jgi:hypothetical protein
LLLQLLVESRSIWRRNENNKDEYTREVQVSLYVKGFGAAAVQIWLQRRILLKN